MKRKVTSHTYRKIYENYHGTIPKDDLGRSYDVHHIDGDHTNNSIDNLKVVSLQEHYDIHLAQGDYAAASAIAVRLKMSVNIVSQLLSEANKKRVAEGTHHLLDGEAATQRNLRRVAEGKHPWSGSSHNKRRVENGTHPWTSEHATRNNQERLSKGTHPSQQKLACPYCNVTCSLNMARRWHFDNCRHRECV